MHDQAPSAKADLAYPAERAAFDRALEKEQVEMLYGGSSLAILANPVVAIIVAISLWQVYPKWLLLVWITLFSLVVAIRLLDRMLYVRNRPYHSAKYWRTRVAIGSSVTGLLWGGFGLSAVLIAPNVSYCVLIIFMIGGMLAGGVLIHSSYPLAYYGYAGFAVVPVVTALITRGDWLSVSMGAGAGAYALAIGLIGHRNYLRVRDNLQLRAQQAALTDNLRTKIAENEIVIAEKRKSEERLHAIFQSVSDAILVYDADTLQLVEANQRVCELFGYSREQIMKWVLGDLFVDQMSWSQNDLLLRLKEVRAGQPQTFEWHGTVKDKQFCWLDVSIRCTTFGGRDFLLATVRDISERKKAEIQLAKMAQFDLLTGLANRGVFVESLERAIGRARRGEGGFAVLYLDLDHFKDVNDTLGHAVGDRLLRAVAERIRWSTKPTDTVARFGGDEFAVLATAISDPAEAGMLADRLLTAVSQPMRINNNNIFIGTSIGIAAYQQPTPKAEAILLHADVALYQAKADGRRVYRYFTSKMESEVRSRFTLTSALREGIAKGQLFLKYQPQVEISTGRIIGLEALVRWLHPERGELCAAEFVSAAEQSGLIFTISHWVLREACAQARKWLSSGIDLRRLAVNLSGVEFKAPYEVETDLNIALAQNRLPAELLEIEVTESTLARAFLDSNNVFQRLRAKGIKIAIDDFGTGYSSLSNLRRFPVDRIKVAQDFVIHLDEDSNAVAIAKAAIGLANLLGIDVIAEGVETKEQAHRLQEWGCREAQGYYFAPPEAAEEITKLLCRGVVSAGSATN